MSTLCDSCKQVVRQEDGCARVMVHDPVPDFQALSVELIPTYRNPPQIDLCAACLTRMVEVLGLPPGTFTPRARRIESVPSPGALTEEDLIGLGLKEG
jgi:hypothetical protein